MLPIDVVVPTKQVGNAWEGVQPSLMDNGILDFRFVTDKDCLGNANVKRNYGAKLGKAPYLFFCDSDVVLMPGILMRMLAALITQPPEIGYVYGNFLALNHPCNGNFVHYAKEFDAEALRQCNYISTMSLIRRDVFDLVGGFDESVERLQDYALWLHMLQHGIKGKYMDELIFATTYGPNGITQREGYLEAFKIVQSKYGEPTCLKSH